MKESKLDSSAKSDNLRKDFTFVDSNGIEKTIDVDNNAIVRYHVLFLFDYQMIARQV